jgi:hypothetical protein
MKCICGKKLIVPSWKTCNDEFCEQEDTTLKIKSDGHTYMTNNARQKMINYLIAEGIITTL